MGALSKFTHVLVRQTAIEICGAFYEDAAKDNLFFKLWPNQKRYIAKHWKFFIKDARAALAQMLTREGVDQDTKDDIVAALFMHQSAPGNMPRQLAQKLVAEGKNPLLPAT